MDTKEVKLFMESTRRNTWLRCGHYALYVRKGMHLIEGRVQSCFDIASVNCDEDQMGKGHFKTLLKALTRLAKIHELEALLIECVLNDRLADRKSVV